MSSRRSSKDSKNNTLSIRYSTIEYRGEQVEFILDPSGHQVFANWRDTQIDLGLDNIYYKEDICRLIDYVLDFITDFPKLPELRGAKLRYFNNAGYRDIVLSYQGRTLKVFLDPSDLISIIQEAEEILQSVKICS